MEEQRERQSRKRGKSEGKSLLPFFLDLFCFILLFAGAGLFYYVKKYMPTKARADLNSYFSVSGDNVELYLNHEKQVEDSVLTLGRMQDGEVYLPYGFVVKQLNIRFLLMTMMRKTPSLCICRILWKSISREKKGKDGKLPYFVDGKNIFLSLSL